MKNTSGFNRRRLLQAGVASQVALAGAGLFGPAAVLAQTTAGPAPYNQIIIPLSDGTRLHARLWLPERPVAAKVPVVMEWIPYRQSDNFAVADSMVHGYFAQQGIAAVRVDIRGSGNSDGLLHDEYLKQEQDDAVEVIAWLAAQDWCNGNVGMIGISWSGFAGLQIAARRPPALKAIVTCCSTDDRYTDDVHFMGGGLLDEDTGIMDEPMLRLWMGSELKPDSRDMHYEGGQWIGLRSWPSSGAVQPFHPDGWALSQRRGRTSAPMLIDTPQNLGAFAGEWTPLAAGKSGDYQADNRPDDGQSVCFDTPVLDAPVEIVGFPVLKLDLAFEGAKALVVVRLNEVQPDGTSARITYAIRRLKRPEGVEAGERFTAEIPLKGVAYRFKPGNRIRLALSTTYWPMVWPEPSQGGVTFWPDATTFTLPATPDTVVTQLPEFGPAVHATPVPSETPIQGRTTRVVSWDAMTGRSQLAMTNGGGLRRVDGQSMGRHGRETFSIMPNDGSSARYEALRVTTRERAGWQVRTESETKIYWENGKLTMENQFRAFEDTDMIFSKDWKNAFTY